MSWTGARWRVALVIGRGGVVAQTVHEGDTCHAVAATTVRVVLREARGAAAGPVEETALYEFVVPGEPVVRAPRTRYQVCGRFFCPGEGVGLQGGAGIRWGFSGTRSEATSAAVGYGGLQLSRWISDDWAAGFGAVIDSNASSAYEGLLARRLVGALPLDPGARLIALGGAALRLERQRTRDVTVRPGLRLALRGEGSFGPMFAWVEAGAQATTAWVELVAFAGIGYRLREAVPEPR